MNRTIMIFILAKMIHFYLHFVIAFSCQVDKLILSD